MVSPQGRESLVPTDTNITLELWDFETGVDAASVVIKVDGVPAWTGDAQQAGFSVTKTVLSGGIRYEINPDANFKVTAGTLLEVEAADLESTPNAMSERLTFCTGAWV